MPVLAKINIKNTVKIVQSCKTTLMPYLLDGWQLLQQDNLWLRSVTMAHCISQNLLVIFSTCTLGIIHQMCIKLCLSKIIRKFISWRDELIVFAVT